MIAIGNGEYCPFCVLQERKEGHHDNPFRMEEGKDFIKHATTVHPKEFEEAVFKNIGGSI